MNVGACLFVSFNFIPVWAENIAFCEEGLHEPHLNQAKTLGEIMRFYQDHLNAAEAFVTNASFGSAAITTDDITSAMNHIAAARRYAQQAVDHARTDMPPRKIHRIEEYVEASQKFVDYMTAYHDRVGELLDPNVDRQEVLSQLRALQREYNNFSARAHARF
jgi:hypothetical protein